MIKKMLVVFALILALFCAGCTDLLDGDIHIQFTLVEPDNDSPEISFEGFPGAGSVYNTTCDITWTDDDPDDNAKNR